MHEFAADHTAALELTAAFILGAVIGLERGWRERERAEGSRVAGLRTFALVGLLGGALGILNTSTGPWPIAAGLLGLGLLAIAAYRENVRVHGGLGATTAVALLLTGVLGVLAGTGQPLLAIAAAVIVAVVLDLKPALHRWLQLVEQRELSAALQLLVLSAVILPWLPDAGYGPYEALNPRRLWWAVVLIAGLSLLGHLAVRVAGSGRGIFLTGLLGGLASSTAATLALARQARAEPALAGSAAAGALAANAMMFVRMTVVVGAFQPALLLPMGGPMLAAAATLAVLALWLLRRDTKQSTAPAAPASASFDLATALGFGALLGALAVLAEFMRDWLGDAGLYGLALASGLVDVDAILLAVMRLSSADSIAAITAITAAGLAAGANMAMKALLATSIGGRAMGRRVAGGYLASLVAAAALAALQMISSG